MSYMNAIEGHVAEIVSMASDSAGSNKCTHLSIGTNFDGSMDMLRELEREWDEGVDADVMFDDDDELETAVVVVVGVQEEEWGHFCRPICWVAARSVPPTSIV